MHAYIYCSFKPLFDQGLYQTIKKGTFLCSFGTINHIFCIGKARAIFLTNPSYNDKISEKHKFSNPFLSLIHNMETRRKGFHLILKQQSLFLLFIAYCLLFIISLVVSLVLLFLFLYVSYVNIRSKVKRAMRREKKIP